MSSTEDRAMTAKEAREHRTKFTGWAGMPPAKHRTEYVDATGRAHESQLAAFMASTKFHLMQMAEAVFPFGSAKANVEEVATALLDNREEIIAILTPPRDMTAERNAANKFADEAGEEAPPKPKEVKSRLVIDEDEDEDDVPERIYDRADVIAAFEAGVTHGARIRVFPSKVLP